VEDGNVGVRGNCAAGLAVSVGCSVKNLERFDWRELITVSDQADQKIIVALDAYFSVFAKVSPEGKCLKCGAVQGGMFGCFTYGLAHGEGRCGKCGWPGRADHYLKAGGEEFAKLRKYILQYHPDFVGRKKRAHAR